MIESAYIRLSGPLQSWAGSVVTGNIVRTEPRPTFSSLRGLLAGALGARRGEWPNWLDDVEFWVREDRKPIVVNEFQTINPLPEVETFRKRLLIAQGRKANSAKALTFTPDAQGGTSIVNRTYLADGEYLVRVTSSTHMDEIENAFSSPAFVTYLGRKAFYAEFPFYLGRGSADAFEKIPVVHRNSDESKAQKSQVVLATKFGRYFPVSGLHSKIQIPVVESDDARLTQISDLLDIRRTAANR
ncbi:CRISPR-associated protein [Corynebacterium diphtheriae HC01]|uniref:Type I-E CRISPR-associated protein Cas5/CasD n=2 Tax=Corynebacterium diphtheriae TaxID=1717 RepID=Q6NEQ9_CORDI|nr:type I-E CRISPR-associated protein Cas5/CasD [Corynebacterium diphtheriae]AEX45149.1 CRISPR-associated protein [Corynebacterium diphtheriae 241]AEX75339.1 CRISPR-associated protein [Corynebacterium diphtheriae HC01]ARB88239.1 type I-E CRISPR-associated protein Cas5/CasD [Corynebacterium diphtheriae]KKA81102.1 CRISPR-associated protein [Corynebacterium diphtheriae]MBG9270544.1 type I-E CRISPR-associated protein Cas5/CasD [Corynebacterium diphtheriae bv. gravis]